MTTGFARGAPEGGRSARQGRLESVGLGERGLRLTMLNDLGGARDARIRGPALALRPRRQLTVSVSAYAYISRTP